MLPPYTLSPITDPTFMLLAASLVGMAKCQVNGKPLSEASLIGSGTFVRHKTIPGILTAAHVLSEIRDSKIALMTFQRENRIARFEIDIEASSDFVFADGWDNGEGPDLAFLRIVDTVKVRDLEALGCVFYNLDRQREPVPPEQARHFCITGVVAASGRLIKTTEQGPPAKGYEGLFAPVASIVALDDREFEIVLYHTKEVPAPPTYGGVSGGGLWATPGLGTVNATHQLIGVAYREGAASPDHHDVRPIRCMSLWEVHHNLLLKVQQSFA